MTTHKKAILFLGFILSVNFCFAQALVAHFTSDCKILCQNGPPGEGFTTVNFTYDGTSPGTTTYSWSFPGGTPTTSTIKNPQGVGFSTAGTSLVTVTAKNGTDSSSFTDTIFVVKKCQSNYTVSSTSLCSGSCVVFADNSNFQPDTWVWTIQTSNSPNHDTIIYNKNPGTICYHDTGRLTIEVKASRTNNCFFQNDFNPGPVIDVSECSPVTSVKINNQPVTCLGEENGFSATVTGGSFQTLYDWSFPGGSPSGFPGRTPPAITYNTPGTYKIILIVTDGSTIDTATSSITVHSCLKDSIIAEPITGTLCTCSTLKVPYSINGSFNPGNTFYAVLTDSAGNVDSVSSLGYIADTLGGNIEGAIPCNIPAGSDYKIFIQSTNPILTSNYIPVSITAQPTSVFTAGQQTTCTGEGDKLTFTGSAAVGARYSWGFAGGTATPGDTTAGPQTVDWATTGQKLVSLSVTANHCTSNTTSKTITVDETPTSTFTSDKDTTCTTSVFTYTGNANGGSYSWTFSGGTPSAAGGSGPQTVSWATQGVKIITLTVTANGCTSTTTTKTVYASICAGVDNINPNSNIEIYPNPVNDKLYVNANSVQINSIEITDILGRTLLAQHSAANQAIADVSNLSTGVYLVSVKCSDGSIVVKKFVKE